MAPRAFWKGWLKLSLVTCRVAMSPATSDREKVRFHTLNRDTGNRIVTRYVDEGTGKPVREEDEARGYASGEDSYVLIEDEDLEAIALDTVRTIDIASFVDRDDVSWLYLDKPHYLVPDDEVGAEAFAVIRDAMAKTGKVALSRLVLYRRERTVMLEPRGLGFVLWTLRYADEVRHFEGAPKAEGKPDKAALGLLGKLIDSETKPWSPDLVTDPVQEGLVDLIAAKRRKRPARKPKVAAPEPTGGNVVNIMDALRRSLKAEGGDGGRSRKR
ncbi:ATP-dependent DNA ligase protein Ku [Azorhizobium caulinodans ORS 571]|uniref:Non-homologous end joining protein Ku n=1 Tax=Azorhizobium caulinodans (strain ATCC 43989 / DSM 5975 / JCM 20966 / LMG 6465 / NBRC 14845 / NCIMB 13405 / ORS 571) TaxID=438753 RepID=A8HV40_AZOC5|nr:Ku protein [Azorhizobium caulinodans]BAF87005.1 ATP-dependent DNA ligase protein Ku [Azorhizobium caulinodans ORS 571]